MRRRLRLLLAAAPLLLVAPPAVAQQATDAIAHVEALTPTSGLVDSSEIKLTVRSDPGTQLFRVEFQQCRLDATYDDPSDMRPPAGNCPNAPLSSSADAIVASSSDRLDPASKSADGARFAFTVGTGAVPLGDGTSTLRCDPTAPCALVAYLTVREGTQPAEQLFQVLPLSFVDADPLAGCGGLADGVLATAGPDRLSGSWAQWTADACATTVTEGAPSRATFDNERTAVVEFAEGELDLAYTGVGYEPAAGYVADVEDPRAPVATPVALNAAVVAIGGGRRDEIGFNKQPYPELRLTITDVAAIFGGGYNRITDDRLPYGARILELNPELAGHLFALTSSLPAAASNAQASTWIASTYVDHHRPEEWTATSGETTSPRDPITSFALADPGFLGVLDLFTGIPAMRRSATTVARTPVDGPYWVLTDLATAALLELTPVAIENADGTFVSPSPENLAAAVPTMEADQFGMLHPDPDAVAAAGAVQPYPLTFVEYAMAPAQPLVDDEGCLRTASQDVVTDWLTYLTTDGQPLLADGLTALTPELATLAAQRIDDVGATPGEAEPESCKEAPPTTPPTTPTTTPTTPTTPVSSNATPLDSGTSAGTTQQNVVTPAPAAPPAQMAEVLDTVELTDSEPEVPIPGFGGVRVPGWLGIAFALLGIAAVTSLAAGVTANGGLMAWRGPASGPNGPPPDSPARIARRAAAVWVPVAIVSLGLVMYLLGPLLQQRDQQRLLSDYRQQVDNAANAGSGLPGIEETTTAPETGEPVGILEIGALELQAVMVEGTGASQTRAGPGHVPGTAGPGQPGNSVVVARNSAFGGLFGDLGQVAEGDPLLVTTVQGQSVYEVTSVEAVALGDGDDGTSIDELYGPTSDDRLTLVTSSDDLPWNRSDATVVVAELHGQPFPPTPQQGRTDSQTGRNGDSGAAASVVLALLLYAGAVAASVALYRRLRPRVAYLLTIAPLVALTVATAETVSRLFPAWM